MWPFHFLDREVQTLLFPQPVLCGECKKAELRPKPRCLKQLHLTFLFCSLVANGRILEVSIFPGRKWEGEHRLSLSSDPWNKGENYPPLPTLGLRPGMQGTETHPSQGSRQVFTWLIFWLSANSTRSLNFMLSVSILSSLLFRLGFWLLNQ